jgi:hypothetical protein
LGHGPRARSTRQPRRRHRGIEGPNATHFVERDPERRSPRGSCARDHRRSQGVDWRARGHRAARRPVTRGDAKPAEANGIQAVRCFKAEDDGYSRIGRGAESLSPRRAAAELEKAEEIRPVRCSSHPSIAEQRTPSEARASFAISGKELVRKTHFAQCEKAPDDGSETLFVSRVHVGEGVSGVRHRGQEPERRTHQVPRPESPTRACAVPSSPVPLRRCEH